MRSDNMKEERKEEYIYAGIPTFMGGEFIRENEINLHGLLPGRRDALRQNVHRVAFHHAGHHQNVVLVVRRAVFERLLDAHENSGSRFPDSAASGVSVPIAAVPSMPFFAIGRMESFKDSYV